MSTNVLGDLSQIIAAKVSYFGTISSATTTNGTGIDTSAYYPSGGCLLAIATGDCGDSTLGVTFKLQESDDDSTYTDVSLNSFISNPTISGATAGDKVVKLLDCHLWSKRYLRAVITTTGGGTLSLPVSASIWFRKAVSGDKTGAINR